MKHIFKCSSCSKYTMREICNCGGRALISRPLKYSENDRFASYRRKAKLNEYVNRGLI